MNKKGMTIGIISGELISAKWMVYQNSIISHFPSGLFWSYSYYIKNFDANNNFATARTEIVKKALNKKSKYLFFIDTDVFIPKDALVRLMSHDADIITGVYWMKSHPPQPVIFKHFGDGPLWKIKPQEKPIEIDGAGLGCCLIKMDVFEKFKEKGIDFFKQDYDTIENGRKIHVNIGEDHWFFTEARKLGFKILCDTNVLCDHYNAKTQEFFPGIKTVKKIAKKELINQEIFRCF